MEAIQVVFEELRKKGKWMFVPFLSCLFVCFNLPVLLKLTLSCHYFVSDLRQPGVVGQKQVPVFSHVETARGVGQVNLPVGESAQPETLCPVLLIL